MGPTQARCPVEIPIVALHRCGEGIASIRAVALGTETVEQFELARRGDFEDGAGLLIRSRVSGRSIEIPVAGLHQTHRVLTVGAGATRRAKTIKCSQFAAEGHSEDRAGSVGAAYIRRAVEISVAAQHQRRPWVFSICAVGLGAKT